jgi:diacylglycerol O-acyltransferase / wax synthase
VDTARLKAGPQRAGLELLLRSTDAWPVPMLLLAGRLIERQPFVNLVVTNVRGPQDPLTLLGAEIREITPIVPLGGNLAVGVAAFSYRGRLVMGINSDADREFDLDAFAAGVDDGFATLRRRRQR